MDDKKKQEEKKVVYEEAEEASDGINDDADLDMDMAKEKIIKLKEKLKKCSKEKEEYLDGWQRSKAEMINYRRRQEEQMAEWLKMAQAGLIKDLLPILDTIEAGIRNWGLGIKENKENYLEKIKEQLLKILTSYGLEEIKTIGEKFNPEFHEAIEQVESVENEDGIIVEEVQKGYLLNGKVLRAAKIKISKK
ncbi:MAG: Protein GrpE [Parcubacteria group bacterium GW2011_GWF2_39_13b]|nr:MAG: Protein GrpE [Parcubacteria group bacterium GW2011_GWF2_39_13b]